MLYIDVTNCHPEYVSEFMRQLCENSILYKSGRKFDCIYILLPNTDYIVKNSQTVSFITTRSDYQLSEEENNLYDLLNFDSFINFLKCKYPPTSSNNQFAKFVKKVKPVSTSSAVYIDFNFEISEFPNENLYQLVTIETLTLECPENIIYVYINNDFQNNPNFDLFINKVISSFEQAIDKFVEKVLLKIKILLINSSQHRRSKSYLSSNFLDFSNKKNDKNDKIGQNNFKLKDLEMKVHGLICKKFKKKTQNMPVNSNFIIEFNEIMDDANKKEQKPNKCRKAIMTYRFSENNDNPQSNKNTYRSLIFALAKKNYLDKLFNKEDIKNSKINSKLMQFLGVMGPEIQKSEEKNEIKAENNTEQNGTIKEKYDNGLEVEIVFEEKEELVNTFQSQFLKSI